MPEGGGGGTGGVVRDEEWIINNSSLMSVRTPQWVSRGRGRGVATMGLHETCLHKFTLFFSFSLSSLLSFLVSLRLLCISYTFILKLTVISWILYVNVLITDSVKRHQLLC